ncbi:MAG: hypothetical protein ACREDU_05490, partial [Methylocella sp.]
AGGFGKQAAFALALALARIPPQDFEDTVRSTIRWLKENRIDVVLVGVQYTVRLARDANYVA